MTASAKDVVGRGLAAWNARDRDGMLATYAEDCELTTPDLGTNKGHTAVAAFFDESMTAFPDNTVRLRTLVSEGAVVVEEGVLSGTNDGPLQMPDGSQTSPTGASIELPYTAVYLVRDGLITESRFYWDQVAMLAQLGLLPPP